MYYNSCVYHTHKAKTKEVFMTVAVIIPAFNPAEFLLDFAKSITEQGLKNIIIVNDGSSKDFNLLFKKLEDAGCAVVNHKENLGKGASLKTGIKAAMERYPDLDGCITAEANDQHTAGDLMKIYKAMESRPGELIMGVRSFTKDNSSLKFRTSFFFSKLYFHIVTKTWHKDTRTVLRGIPKEMFPLALSTEGERYEYELNFFINAVQNGCPYYNQPVESNLNKNHVSHFRPFRDTILLFKTPIKFAASSLSCYIIELTAFSLLSIFLFSKNALGILISTVIARVISGAVNFTLNKKWSFQNNKKWTGQFLKYAVLFVCQMTLSWLLVTLLSSLPAPITIIKAGVDLVLFALNYLVQKNWVFKTKND